MSTKDFSLPEIEHKGKVLGHLTVCSCGGRIIVRYDTAWNALYNIKTGRISKNGLHDCSIKESV